MTRSPAARRRVAGALLLLFFCMLIGAGSGRALGASEAGADPDKPMAPCLVGGDFWINGLPPQLTWPAGLAEARRGGDLVFWGSWCDGEARQGTLFLGPFKAPAHFDIAVAGLPVQKGDALMLVRVKDNAERLVTHAAPGDAWKQLSVNVPAGWVGDSIEIAAADRSTDPDGWVGLSEPYTLAADGSVDPLWKNRAAGLQWHHWLAEIVGPLILNFFLLGLIGTAGLSMLRRFVPAAPYLTPLLIAAVAGLAGYVTFWAFLIHSVVGWCVALGFILLSIARVGYCLLKKNASLLRREDRKELKCAVPLFLIAAIFYLGVMWLPSVIGTPIEVVASRRPSAWALPIDNELQQNLAQALYSGMGPRAADFPQWSSSDRPPLAAGIELLTAPLLC
ncbi:MAG TPA: hypothetical protein VHY37_09090, partial [Tepidisphaeraceae bacterium]|nr:hypothetical protein [Tepidisphaeraceae bacterium]